MDGTLEEGKGRRGNKYSNLDAIHGAARNKCLEGVYPPQDRYFQGVRCRLQLSEDPLDVSLRQTDTLIRSLETVFCQGT